MNNWPAPELANWRVHPWSVRGFREADRLVPTHRIRAGGTAMPLPQGTALDLSAIGCEHGSALSMIERSHTDGFLVLHRGSVVAEHYFNGHGAGQRHIIFSVSKSITAVLAGILAAEGRLDTDSPVTRYVPELAESAYGDAKVRHVLDMTVSVDFVEDYLDPAGPFARYRAAMLWNPDRDGLGAAGLKAFLATLPKGARAHGERFHYVSPNSDLLGWIVERAAGTSFAALMSERFWRPLGAADDAVITVDGHGAARTAGGMMITLRDMARVGEAMRRAASGGNALIPAAFVSDLQNGGSREAWAAGDMTVLFPSGRYRSKWYMPDLAPGCLVAIGIHGQWIWVDPVAAVVIVRQSSQPVPVDDAIDQDMLALFRRICLDLS